MIRTLKQRHNDIAKVTLLELKKNPELLQEYYDQRQLEKMVSMIRILSDVVSNYGSQSTKDALTHAYTDLEDYMSMSKVKRALKLNTGLKKIETLINGLINMYTKQLPYIVEITVGKMNAGMDSVEPIRTLLVDQENIEKFYNNVKKALKPGFFGINDIPYLETDIFANDVLDMSPKEIMTVKSDVEKKFSTRRQQGNRQNRVTQAKPQTTTPSSPAQPPKPSAAPATVAASAASVSMSPTDFSSLYNQSFTNSAKGLTLDQAELKKLHKTLLKDLYVSLIASGYIK